VSNPSTGERVEVVLIYQSSLGLTAITAMRRLIKRLAWRGYEPVLTVVEPGDPLPNTGQIYLLGGGEDASQVTAVRTLKADGVSIGRSIAMSRRPEVRCARSVRSSATGTAETARSSG
jgi:lipid II isoglutaminyl synthase (glutamine-hydrolysing)